MPPTRFDSCKEPCNRAVPGSGSRRQGHRGRTRLGHKDGLEQRAAKALLLAIGLVLALLLRRLLVLLVRFRRELRFRLGSLSPQPARALGVRLSTKPCRPRLAVPAHPPRKAVCVPHGPRGAEGGSGRWQGRTARARPPGALRAPPRPPPRPRRRRPRRRRRAAAARRRPRAPRRHRRPRRRPAAAAGSARRQSRGAALPRPLRRRHRPTSAQRRGHRCHSTHPAVHKLTRTHTAAVAATRWAHVHRSINGGR